jgi:hypothetical protein
MAKFSLYKFLFTAVFCTCIFQLSFSQVLTSEDSLQAGLESSDKSTFISGYGEAKYQNDLKNHTATANLTRAVLFVGHRFNNKISFFSELEVEDAKVAGGEPGGEVAFEQLFLKFNISKDIYLNAGLFTPRIGIINENHLPVSYNGNDRPMVETLIIPATWRELGICLYGNVRAVQGLNYSFGLVNGLNSATFENGTGIREGRFEGREATASNLAVTGSLLYYYSNFRFQLSGYYGGSAGLSKTESDSLNLNAGAFGTPVALEEANVQYENNGFEIRALFSVVQIPDAENINSAYASNTSEMMTGTYVEAGYNILKLFNKSTERQLTYFIRYENLNLNSKIPGNGIKNDFNKQQYITTGLTYHPIKGVVIKADYQYKKTAEADINTFSYLNLGLGYSF